MWKFIVILTIVQTQVLGYWDKEIKCPEICKCRLEHASELPIHRFMPKEEEIDKPAVPEAIVLENNDVFYDSDLVFEEASLLRTATCVIQSEITVQKLLEELPKEINSLVLIQATNAGNKTLKFSDFTDFDDLKIIELQSAQPWTKNKEYSSIHFILDIDVPLPKINYLNFERTILTNSQERLTMFENEILVFEHVQRSDDGHSLTFLEKRTGEILPYQTYKENLKGEDGPLFMGFTNLNLLRLYDCEIHHIHREMFEGLVNLHYLILEKNKLQFISEFAFYGAPNLKLLSLAWNNLLNIEIRDLAGLLELEYLDLSHNNFTQLSELSLPPFPKLKLCNFANNPITDIFPNTFEVMNTTYALVVGGLEEPMTLQTNSFLGLNLLMSLKLYYLNIPIFERDILRGMPNLQVLVMTGNIPEIQYDAFLEVINLDTLILSTCNLSKLSVDSFIGLEKLRVLDLSKNNLSTLPPAIFDVLTGLHELYLHENHFQTLPQNIFSHLPARLIRLTENPWHCSCDMSDWKPMIVNRIKQKTIKVCDHQSVGDKGLSCPQDDKIYYKYIFDNSIAPKCLTPQKFLNWSVFHVMKRQFRCVEFKPKMKKRLRKRLHLQKGQNATNVASAQNMQTNSTEIVEGDNDIENDNSIIGKTINNIDTTTRVDLNNNSMKSEHFLSTTTTVNSTDDEQTAERVEETSEMTADDIQEMNQSLKNAKLEKLKRKFERAMKIKKHNEMQSALFAQNNIVVDNNDANNNLN